MAGFVYTCATETREWYLDSIRQRYSQTFEEYQHLLEETRMRQFERDLEIERERLEAEEEEECTTTDDDDDDDDDFVDERGLLSEEEELSDDEFPAPVPPRRGAAADTLREASELLFEHKDCLPEGVYLKIFDALKCQWDGDYVAD